MTEPAANIVGQILALQQQRLSKLDDRTKSLNATVEELAETMRQIVKVQNMTYTRICSMNGEEQ